MSIKTKKKSKVHSDKVGGSTKTTKKKGTKKKVAKGKSHAGKGMGTTETAKVKTPKRTLPETPKHSSNLLLTTLAIGATGVLGYLGWDYLHRKKMAQIQNENANIISPHGDTHLISPVTPQADPTFKKKTHKQTETGKGEFPLKKGSKGESVRKVQQALLDKNGSSILPKYGADGDFGSEMARALKKLGFPATISKSTYNVIVGGEDSSGSGNSGSDAHSDLAEKLYNAVEAGNLDSTISLLKQIESKEEYKQVSNTFKENYRIGGVRETLVNATLTTFTDETQKQEIRYEFLRMGLQYDGNKWSLSGFEGLPIITTRTTTIWTGDKKTVEVPANTILGNEVEEKSGFTRFENDGRMFFVQSSAVRNI